MAYAIKRFYFEGDTEVIDEVDTLEEAQARCQDPEGSSRTATSDEATQRTETHGPWFEGFEEL